MAAKREVLTEAKTGMHTNPGRVMLVGHYAIGALECSYRSAFDALGWQVHSFDISKAVDDHCRGGRLGRLFNTFVQVEPWIRKANRDLVLAAIEFQPDVLVSFGHYPLRVGALAQIRTSTHAALVSVWPDPFVNWNTHLTGCLPMFDLVATFSQATVPVFARLGAPKAAWVPLAGDPSLHTRTRCVSEDHAIYGADLSFIGGWRPEREAALSLLDGFNVRIWGPDWGRRAKRNSFIRKAWQGRAIYGAEFAKAVACSKVNLNVIDATISQSPNMRFFEIMMAGGLQLGSYCPEMAEMIRHGEHVFYFRKPEQLPDLLRQILENEGLRAKVAQAGYEAVLAGHTYRHRAEQILGLLGVSCT